MEQRKLGKGGPDVPAIGLGTWPIGGGMGTVEEKAAIVTIRKAIECGITLLDSAQAYRTSESIVGKALKGGYRERCFLATKVSGNYSSKDIETAIEKSLSNLNVDYVDLYQIHNWKSDYPIEESMETMEKLRKAGKTRYIGVSNFDADQMQQAMRTAAFQSNQPRYNLFDRKIEGRDMAFCEEHGIGILVHSPLAKGLLTGKYKPGHEFADDDERSRFERFQGERFARYLAVAEKLQILANSKGISLIQLAISWVLRQEVVSCVLVGAKSPQQVEEHLGAVGIRFDETELQEIDNILKEAPQDG